MNDKPDPEWEASLRALESAIAAWQAEARAKALVREESAATRLRQVIVLLREAISTAPPSTAATNSRRDGWADLREESAFYTGLAPQDKKE